LAYEQLDQPGGIDILIEGYLFYEMLRSGRRTHPGNYPVLQETVLGWTHTGLNPATTTQNDPEQTFLFREDNSLEHNLNRFWEVAPVKQSTPTTVQQDCEQHSSQIKPNKKTEDLLLVSPRLARGT